MLKHLPTGGDLDVVIDKDDNMLVFCPAAKKAWYVGKLESTPLKVQKPVAHVGAERLSELRPTGHSPLDTLVSQALVALGALQDWQCDTIASDCVRSITGSSRPYRRSDILQQYGVNSSAQCRAIGDRVTDDELIGVPRYGCTLDRDELNDLDSSWTMGDLANRICDKAV